jgi:hypothetical protein
LVAGGAEAALFAGEGEEEFVAAIGTVQAREAGVQIAAAQKRRDGGGGFGENAIGGWRAGVVVEDLPDGRGARLAGAVADADHGGVAVRGVSGPGGKG